MFLTRTDIAYCKTKKGWPIGDKLVKGKGVSRFLYGYKKLNDSAKIYARQGTEYHAELETGNIISQQAQAASDWLRGGDFKAVHKEVFMHGKLFGINAVAFADLLVQDAEGNWILADYKFSLKPKSQWPHAWGAQLVLEAMLMRQMYGIAINQAVVAIVHTKTCIVQDWLIGKQDFAGFYAYAKQMAMKHGII